MRRVEYFPSLPTPILMPVSSCCQATTMSKQNVWLIVWRTEFLVLSKLHRFHLADKTERMRGLELEEQVLVWQRTR